MRALSSSHQSRPAHFALASVAALLLSMGHAEAQTASNPGWPGPALGWPTDGRPVTEKDLVGKKICWNDGGSGVFAASGQYTDFMGHRRPWLVTEPGVVKIGLKYRQFLVLPDGSFYQHTYVCCSSIDGHKEYWGKVCN